MSTDNICSEIPNHYRDKLEKLLGELEQETGQLYTFKVRQYGKQSDLKIKPFENRGNYRVYNMTTGYEALEGNYNDEFDLSDKINLLRLQNAVEKDVMVELYKEKIYKPTEIPDDKRLNLEVRSRDDQYEGVVWVCPKCSHYKDNVSTICQKCFFTIRSHWDYTRYDFEQGIICSVNDSGLGVLIILGYIEIINDNNKAQLQSCRPSGKFMNLQKSFDV